jgi:NhaA family Na+:H+ antiporter
LTETRPAGARRRTITKAAQAFLHHEAAGGIVLTIAAAVALLIANSALFGYYDTLLNTPVTVKIGTLGIDKPLLLWINDGLMAIFFCLVGLEIKRELMVGELSTRDQALLPAIAAVGGMAVPAAIYVAINSGSPETLKGWAIPAATDIAFAVGVLSLLGPRVPVSLKVFLLALAIIDDLGAIIIIALFYTASLSMQALLLAALGIAVLITLNVRGVDRIAPYVLVGTFIWICVLKSGVHATLAGVIVGLCIPMQARAGEDGAPVQPLARLQESLHPWVAFAILPIFGFANAGVSLIAGIGFTMSLFIGTLAFPEPEYAAAIRIGVLTGSLLSAVLGYLVLSATLRAAPPEAARMRA